MKTLRLAFALVTPRLVVLQIIVAITGAFLSVVWLQMPDSSVFGVAATVLLGLVILSLAGAGESWIVLRLASDAPRITGTRLLRGTLLLFAATALWLLSGTLFTHLQVADSLRAGYLNSQAPRSLRGLLSYSHIYVALGWLWTTLSWSLAGVLAAFAVTFTVSPRSLGSVLRSGTYWLTVVLGSIAVIALTQSLMNWAPGHGLIVETVSLILRLTVTVLIDATYVTLLLAILAVRIRQATPAGTPNESQPRTAEIP